MSHPVNWFKRVGWVAALWLAGVACMALIALAVRVAMHWAGMKS